MNFFVAGIDTDSGKTLVSAILCEAWEADYWKPVQAGFPADSQTVRELLSNSKSRIYPEAFVLNTPASPHAAAKIDGVMLKVSSIRVPQTQNRLIVEGAGGCLVPLNDREFVIDLVPHCQAELILVADLYLGSINHTLLTVEAIRKRNLPVKGIIFNGDRNPESERIILHHSGFPQLLHIDREKNIDKEVVRQYAMKLKSNGYA
jgi:dethiobiotin synthetase